MQEIPESADQNNTTPTCGDNASNFKEIYALHGRNIYNYLLWMTKDVETSQDILQTVFIRAWEASSLPGNEDALRRWLFITARNAFFDSYRSHRRFLNLRVRYAREYYQTPPEPSGGPFREMLSECSDDERSILYLHLKAGYSYGEIGSILDLSESNVRVKACRAIKRLRELYIRRKRYEE
jgi:RNA polymerase sigma-70 factor (ECF subfamily)